MEEIILDLQNISKSFGDTHVFSNINLSIAKGEFITILGSSGCGKTTLLRIIAGLESPDDGKVILEGEDVTFLEPNKRNVNTVFQNYALFPHMKVGENIAYSLKLKKMPKDEIKKTVNNALELVQLEGFEDRTPAELSGGQRQRVAIARAIVNNPRVLLLDEPLGALDLQLRRQMQNELKHMQKRLGITFIYITHDQEEALNMSDRIVMMHDGEFEQIGKPNEIYNNPKTSYVAKFIGESNVIGFEVDRSEGNIVYCSNENGNSVATNNTGIDVSPKQKINVSIRGENIEMKKCNGQHTTGIVGHIKEISFSGAMLRISVEYGKDQTIIASMHGIETEYKVGDKVCLSWEPENAIIVDLEVGKGEVEKEKK